MIREAVAIIVLASVGCTSEKATTSGSASQPVSAPTTTAPATTAPSTPPPPVRLPSATYAFGEPKVQGALDFVVALDTTRADSTQMVSCFQQGLLKDPDLMGTVQLEYTIGSDGKVTHVTASGLDPAVAECVAGRVRGLVFPARAQGQTTVSLPITFQSL